MTPSPWIVGTASKSFHVKQKTPIPSLTVQLLLLPIGCQDNPLSSGKLKRPLMAFNLFAWVNPEGTLLQQRRHGINSQADWLGLTRNCDCSTPKTCTYSLPYEGKRPHIKTHGMMNFVQVDQATKSIYQELEGEGRMLHCQRYLEAEVKKWNCARLDWNSIKCPQSALAEDVHTTTPISSPRDLCRVTPSAHFSTCHHCRLSTNPGPRKYQRSSVQRSWIIWSPWQI